MSLRSGSPQNSNDKIHRSERKRPERVKRSKSVDALTSSSPSIVISSDLRISSKKTGTRPPQGHSIAPDDTDLLSQTDDLDRSARKAVSSADDVTLALLLTSWANSLSEARQHAQLPATQFEIVFRASQALDIVSIAVLELFPQPDSPVCKALISLFSFVLYGDHRLFVSICEHVAKLNAALSKLDVSNVSQRYRGHRDKALSKIIHFLKNVFMNVRAFSDVLPNSPEIRDRPLHLANKPANDIGESSKVKISSSNGNVGLDPNHGSIAPEPIGAVKCSMDAWGRVFARLQGEVTLISVLNDSMRKAETELCLSDVVPFQPLNDFFDEVRDSVRRHIEADVRARMNRLKAVYWADVIVGAETTVFKATRDQSDHWIGQLDEVRLEIEQKLIDYETDSGNSARAADEKISALIPASSGVASLVYCQERAFTWACETAKLLRVMSDAVRELENVAGDCRVGPSLELSNRFQDGVDRAFTAIDGVLEWSFETLRCKVMDTLVKSIEKSSAKNDGTDLERPRTLRFEEPPETSAGRDMSENDQLSGSRRKMRHMRMKSSPDALLHLNAQLDGYSNREIDPNRSINRDINLDNHAGVAQDAEISVSFKFGEIIKTDEESSITIKVDSDTTQCGTEKKFLSVDSDCTSDRAVEEDDDEADDRDIIVHGSPGSESETRKVHSHVRSMSVDGMPF